MSTAPDRLKNLLAQNQLTGIDFVYVFSDQQTLEVHFLQSPSALASPLDAPGPAGLALEDIRIFCSSDEGSMPDIPIVAMNWNGELLRLQTAQPGDFTLYKLRISDARIDRYYRDAIFSFKANCPSDLDCAPQVPDCPPDKEVDAPVQYLARDFWSFRKALLDFASLRYPDWSDRLAADAGIMMTELMSALGDEMAYYQDRIAREAHLETASQRRSLRRHARLIDYQLHDGQGSTSWLDITVAQGQTGNLPAGTNVWAENAEGRRSPFEIGQSLAEQIDRKTYLVDARRNSLVPHCWDEDDTCLPVGATELFARGHLLAQLPFDDLPPGKAPGKWVLLKTSPDPSLPARAHLVRLIHISESRDEILGQDITRLEWEPAQATPFEMDMRWLRVRANVLPVSSGQTHRQLFVVGQDSASIPLPSLDPSPMQSTIARQGPDGLPTYLFSLPQSDEKPLTFLKDADDRLQAEIHLEEVTSNGNCWQSGPVWEHRSSLLASFAHERHFTLDDGIWRVIQRLQRAGKIVQHIDYASGEGRSIRFGDNQFGLIPRRGTIFRLWYRLGGSRRSNVAAESLTHIALDPPSACTPLPPPPTPAPPANLDFVHSISNPLPAQGGADRETPDRVRQLAPDAYRAITYRAVRPEDYAEAVERMPQVQRAGAAFRWTGSWLASFTTPDPMSAVRLERDLRRQIVDQLDRFRQAGREAHVLDPVYADLDLTISVCVAPDAYRAQVKEAVLKALIPHYFSPDRFTFGTPLERSTLEEHIQSVPGVRAVKDIRIRRRGWFDWRLMKEWSYRPGMNAILRVANDSLHPERGTLTLKMTGGA
ncbi:MAG: hypothetical protein AAFV95_10465 [Bacteroidota bacterium]